MATIDDFQEQLLAMKAAGKTHPEMLSWLGTKDVDTSLATIGRRFRDWGIRKKTSFPTTDELIAKVKDLYTHEWHLSDEQIARRCTDEAGNGPTANQVRDIRLKYRFVRRVTITEESAEKTVSTRQHVYELITNGPGRSYGIRWATHHLRRILGYHARYTDVADALREFDPAGVRSRTPGLYKLPRQENYITAGPNEIWSCDGHDKLRTFSFQVYAAVDAYSRKILWIYCGNANRSSICVLNQYIQAVKHHSICPSAIRVDKGKETVLMAAAQHTFYLEALAVDTAISGLDMDPEATDITNTTFWGTSPRNVRIERLWFQTKHETLGSYIRLFQLFQKSGLFNGSLPDLIVIQFVFMPILRQELVHFMDTHNEYPIRRQAERAYHIRGVPNQLYEDTEHQHGFAVHLPTLHEWEEQLAQFGGFFPFPHRHSAAQCSHRL